MKNVRLFAVAAALGMFASTVAATDAAKTSVKWDNKLDVIRVDEGQKIILPTPTAQAVVEDEKAGCQNGTDANNDGYVDALSFGLSPEVFDEGWFVNTDELWTSTEEAVEALTLHGVRVLEPNSDEIEDEFYVNELTGKTYSGIEEFFKGLIEEGVAVATYNEDDELVKVVVKDCPIYNASYTKVVGQHRIVVEAGTSKKAEEEMIKAVVDWAVNGTTLATDAPYYTVADEESSLFNAANTHANIIIDGNVYASDINYKTGLTDAYATVSPIVYVEYNSKKDAYSFVDATFANVGAADSTNSIVEGQVRYVYNAVKGSTAHVVTPTDAYSGNDYTANTYYIKKVDVLSGANTITKTTDGTTSAVDGDVVLDVIDITATNVKKSSATYVALDNTSSFVGSEMIYLDQRATDVYNTQYDIADSNGEVDLIVVRKADANGYYTDSLVDYTTDTIKVKVSTDAGATYKWVEVTAKNASVYWTYEFLAGGSKTVSGTTYTLATDGIMLDNTVVDSSDFETTYAGLKPVGQAATTYALITKLDDAYDYAFEGVAYDTTSYNSGLVTAWTTAAYAARNTVFNDLVVFDSGKLANPAYNAVTKQGKAGYITVIDVTKADEYEVAANSGNYDIEDANLVAQYKLEPFADGAIAQDYVLSIDENGQLVFTTERQDNNQAGNAYYIPNTYYEMTEVPANDTNLYVLFTGTNGFEGLNFTYSTIKETGTITTFDDQEIPCKLVNLGTSRNPEYFPAFDTEEDLKAAVAKITGVTKALEGSKKEPTTSFYKWYVANGSGSSLPTSAASQGEKCSYEVKSAATVSTDLNGLVLDGSAKAGVYDVKYTATVDGKAVGEVGVTKVVVAPKYERLYSNGKVVKCTSYYANDPTKVYSVTEYDWTKGVATVTYFDVNAAPAGTQELPLK